MDNFLTELGKFHRQSPKLPGRLIMTRIAGSRSYNVDLLGSDYDWYGVYVTPLPELLSLDPPASNVQNKESEKPDFQFHELAAFCKLIVLGNPHMVESLFCSKGIHVGQEWEGLHAIRHRFLTRKVLKNYVECGRGHIRRYRHEPADGDKKWLYHSVRLAQDAARIARGLEPIVWKEGEEQQLLLRIRRREIPDDEVVSMAENMFAAVEDAALPEEPDKDALEMWMLRVRGLEIQENVKRSVVFPV